MPSFFLFLLLLSLFLFPFYMCTCIDAVASPFPGAHASAYPCAFSSALTRTFAISFSVFSAFSGAYGCAYPSPNSNAIATAHATSLLAAYVISFAVSICHRIAHFTAILHAPPLWHAQSHSIAVFSPVAFAYDATVPSALPAPYAHFTSDFLAYPAAIASPYSGSFSTFHRSHCHAAAAAHSFAHN